MSNYRFPLGLLVKVIFVIDRTVHTQGIHIKQKEKRYRGDKEKCVKRDKETAVIHTKQNSHYIQCTREEITGTDANCFPLHIANVICDMYHFQLEYRTRLCEISHPTCTIRNFECSVRSCGLGFGHLVV